MRWGWRLLIFTLPVVLATICKVAVTSANDPAAFDALKTDPTKLVDIAFDLVLTAASVFLGLLFYARGRQGTLMAPNGQPVSAYDIVVCGSVVFCSLIVIFALLIISPKIDYIRLNHNALFSIWMPDLFGLFALAWVVRKLT